MRFATSALLALPLLAAALEVPEPINQYVAQFSGLVDNLGSYLPNPNRHDAADAAESKTGEKKMSVLTMDNWRETLYAPVIPASTEPVEWWLFITGGNRSCFGHCHKIEAAWNQSAVAVAKLEKPPRVAYVNCDHQAILCSSWSAAVGSLWLIKMLPEPADIDIYVKRLNLTSTTSQDFVEMLTSGTREDFKLNQGMFHPFNGPIAKSGLAVPVGYVMWAFSLIPSWSYMLLISFLSRSMMGRRQGREGGAAPPGGAAPAPGAGAK